MKLQALQRRWNEAGKQDPFWAVLSAPDKKGNRWQVDEFFQTGVDEIRSLMGYLDSLGIPLGRTRALDFGCGPGRLSQALAEFFERVDGVDISPSMIELAKESNRLPDRVHYHINDRDDLQLFAAGTFDLVYSSLTLQHVKPPLIKRYLCEFLRVTKPNGFAVFQLPSRPGGPIGQLKRVIPGVVFDAYRRVAYGSHPANAMYGIAKRDVIDFCQASGATVLDVTPQPRDRKWESFRYVVQPTGGRPGVDTPPRTLPPRPAG